MHRVKLFLVVTLVASIFPVAAQATAAESPTSSPSDPAFGVQFHATWSDYSDAQRLEVLDKLAEAGVKWVRVDMGWASFQEDSPDSFTQYHVDKADWIVNQARARGIDVLGMLWRTPEWANGGAGTATPPTNAADYGKIARWAAEHFKGRVAGMGGLERAQPRLLLQWLCSRLRQIAEGFLQPVQGRRPGHEGGPRWTFLQRHRLVEEGLRRRRAGLLRRHVHSPIPGRRNAPPRSPTTAPYGPCLTSKPFMT